MVLISLLTPSCQRLRPTGWAGNLANSHGWAPQLGSYRLLSPLYLVRLRAFACLAVFQNLGCGQIRPCTTLWPRLVLLSGPYQALGHCL